MNARALLLVAAAAISAPAAAQDAEGEWAGVLQVSDAVRLPLRVHISSDDAGALSGTLDSPSQGANGLPLTEVALVEGRLTFKVPVVGGEYTGTWNSEANVWQGEWQQGGAKWPLNLAVPPPPRPLPADWQLPSDADISALIAERNAPRAGQGIVVGVLGPEGQRIVSGGTGAGAAVDANTLFEIGSITKVFTALILADMVNKGEVSLDDAAAKYLPPGHHMPERGGRQITLRDLSTHRSSLPRMVDDIGEMTDPGGPFASYTEARLLAFLDRYELTRDIGSQAEYSNLAVGLLGYLLGRAAGSDYQTLLRERITGPLGMRDTVIDSQSARLAPAFDGYMRPTQPWHLGVHEAAGGILSSATDMLKFAAAVLDPDSPIGPAMRTALSVRLPGINRRADQHLGWVALRAGEGREFLLHDGGTGGFRTLLAIDPAKRRAVVTLVNSGAEPGATDLGLRVLAGGPMAPTGPVPPAPAVRTEVSLPLAELERVVGRYQFDAGFVVAVTLNDGVLRARNEAAPNAQPFPIYAEAPLAYFWKVLDAQIRFITDTDGKVTGAELTQGGTTLRALKLEP